MFRGATKVSLDVKGRMVIPTRYRPSLVQSAQGKLIQGLCGRAQGTPVIALCGKLSATPDQVKTIGLKTAYCINREERPLAEMLANTAVNLEKSAAAMPL